METESCCDLLKSWPYAIHWEHFIGNCSNNCISYG